MTPIKETTLRFMGIESDDEDTTDIEFSISELGMSVTIIKRKEKANRTYRYGARIGRAQALNVWDELQEHLTVKEADA